MTLAAMLAAHDEAALTALASPGLVRRAVKDAAASKGGIVAVTGSDAEVNADGQTVHLTSDGPRVASCTCPATGMCRHIVLAVLTLRQGQTEAEDDETGASAQDEILALSVDDLAKFAGADLSAALALASESGATTSDSGGTVSVTLPGRDDTVTFIPGQGLAGAVHKGPKTRRRLMIAAAALVSRQAGDAPVPNLDEKAQADPLTDADLDRAAGAVRTSLRQVLTGTGDIAAEQLYDLAITARAQAAPRLTGQLRSLSEQADHAARHDVRFDEGRFLIGAGRTAALIEALRSRRDDPALAGDLRRTYSEQPPFELWIAGVHRWQTPQGARGLRVYGYSPEKRAWFIGGPARGAGMDPQFRASTAYTLPLWGKLHPKEMSAQMLRMTAPQVSEDNRLSMTTNAELAGTDQQVAYGLVEDSGAIHRSWRSLRNDLGERLRAGLSALGIPVPVLLQPYEIGKPAFDDMAQLYIIPVFDDDGMQLDLQIPANDSDLANYLGTHLRSSDTLLCEAEIGHDQLRLIPVSHLRTKGRTVEQVNLSLDRLPARSAAVSWLQYQLKRRRAGSREGGASSAILDITDAALDAAVIALTYGDGSDLDSVARHADALALGQLQSWATRASDGDPGTVLRLAYVVGEVRRKAILAG